MKRLLLVLVLALSLAAPITFTGCQTSPIKAAYAIDGVTTYSANTALSVWASYAVLREQQLHDPNLSAETRDELIKQLKTEKAKVDEAHNRYKESRRLYETAVRGYWTAQTPDVKALDVVIASLEASSANIASLVLSLLPDEQKKNLKTKLR